MGKRLNEMGTKQLYITYNINTNSCMGKACYS